MIEKRRKEIRRENKRRREERMVRNKIKEHVHKRRGKKKIVRRWGWMGKWRE